MHSKNRTGRLAAGLLLSLGAMNATACEAPPPAVIDIDANSYYIDSNHSVIDPVRKARNVANTKPIEDFLAHISSAASNYQADPVGKADEARCALAWFAAWAEQHALLGKMTSEQSYYQRKWTLGGLALSFARMDVLSTGAQRQSILGWLKSLAEVTLLHSEAHKGTRNNHYYWEGLAVTAVGAVTKEARYLDWGRKVFDAAMDQVAPDGSLPQEMKRAVKALHYHEFAVTPLVMIASILDLHSAKLDQLVRFTLDGASNPAGIEKATGFKQEMPGNGAQSWEAIYARHEPKSGLQPVAPGRQPRLGGDLALANPLEHVEKK
ncbi:MAG: alginate lyase family protein [Pseudomonadota bacterium]